ncbi:polysaccharide biosynthesis/export family protein [Hydrogenophaga sp. RWCD_12]|uniref:polysaccharide biosynthesis/export family protein n=1 Tax=Hydrogenophaga sp. RWCD_12 TaxID=3391190 RepID=UPI0039847D6D
MRKVLCGLAMWAVFFGGPAFAQAAAPDNSAATRQNAPPAGQPSQPQPLDTLAGLSADYRVSPNDLIDMEVYGVPELKKTLRVNSSGQITLPLVGNLAVVGMTGQQVEQAIAAAFADKYLQNPQVSIYIKEFTVRRVTVEGAVAKPGIYPVTGELTLLRAIALAGGGGNYANLSEIMLYRKGADGQQPTQQTFNLEAIRDGKNPDPVVLADDVIVVKRSAARAALRDSLFRDIIDSINPFSGLTPR